MAYRDFRDSTGTRWQAWDVIPQLVERRQGLRRAQAPTSPDLVIERRTGRDRRVTASRRASLGAGYDQGWLCFESAAEKRRLTPIPTDWQRCRDAQLERYCRQASPVRRVATPLVRFADSPQAGEGGLAERSA